MTKCPNCRIEPDIFQDQVKMWLITCPLCGLVTGQHKEPAAAWSHWRYLVKSVRTKTRKSVGGNDDHKSDN